MVFHYPSNSIKLLSERRNYRIDDSAFHLIKQAQNGNPDSAFHLAVSKTHRQLLELAIHQKYKWPLGYSIKVFFLNNEPRYYYDNQQVIDWANEWNRYANISFATTNDIADADIRLEYSTDGGCWAELGTRAKGVLSPNATIHLTMFNDTQIDRATVLHEFGHVLGCIHEHQSPAAGISWNIPYIYSKMQVYGWNKQKVDHNIINRFNHAEISNTTYDNQSIMIYPIHDWMTTDGYCTNQVLELSDTDKEFIAMCYPY